ncbi:hypothetical protein [Nonomuraea sp. NPDC049750]
MAKNISSPLDMASNSASQSSPGRKPLVTMRNVVLPWSRPSTRNS